MSLGPLARYQAAIEREEISSDPAQATAVAELQRIFEEGSAPAPRGFFRRRQRNSVRGLYMYGGVGRGKTMLMDLLAADMPDGTVRRSHFHHFMADTHEAIRNHSGTSDPLQPIAEQLASETRVLCFDEFFVSDVADAMILGRLMTLVFEQGLALVATSNIAPVDLYRNGLQRERFLPAIAAVEAHCHVLCVDGGTDYRLRELRRAHTYHHPLSEHTDRALRETFSRLAPDSGIAASTINILGRPLNLIAQAHDVAWFRFTELCEGPRSANDYIEIAREFGTVILSDIPQMNFALENAARRFLHLVDEFYDRRVKLILSAAVPLNQLYAGHKLGFEFARAMSRLEEMQSEEYLAQPHQPV